MLCDKRKPLFFFHGFAADNVYIVLYEVVICDSFLVPLCDARVGALRVLLLNLTACDKHRVRIGHRLHAQRKALARTYIIVTRATHSCTCPTSTQRKALMEQLQPRPATQRAVAVCAV
jgi:hypothetical protein